MEPGRRCNDEPLTPFAITAPARILIGRGEAQKAPGLIRAFGTRGLVVHGSDGSRAAWLIEAFGPGIAAIACKGEPTLADLLAALKQARDWQPEWVTAIGGGSTLDLGKALAALIPAPEDPLEHLELVGRGRPLVANPIPFIALPTTAGTGAEVTRNAVIGVVETGRKVSLRDDRMIARLAIVDPALTDHCPRNVTLASGLDALTQVIEPFVSSKATPYTDALALPAIASGLRALQALMARENPVARDQMAWVSLSGGLALSNAGLGAVHGLSGVIGGMTGAAHGAICGALLGPILAANRAHATAAARSRLDKVCIILAEVLGCSSEEAPQALQAWARDAGLPGLSDLGARPDQHAEIAQASLATSSMKANPVALSTETLVAALESAAG